MSKKNIATIKTVEVIPIVINGRLMFPIKIGSEITHQIPIGTNTDPLDFFKSVNLNKKIHEVVSKSKKAHNKKRWDLN